jgi:hypothetical protein
MRLRYSLYKLAIHKNPNAYKARLVVGKRVATISEIAHMMVSQGSTVGYADIVAVLEELVVALVNLLSLGFRIHLPFANFELTIHGVFDGIDDEFDPRRHSIYISVTAGKRLRKDIRRKIQLSKDQQAPQTPNPRQYLDLESGERNQLVTPGGVGQVTGYRLRFDPDDPQQGIFFVDQESRRAVRVESMIQNRKRELFFKVPSLPAGTYRIQVRAYIYSSPDVRSGELAKTLIVP